MERKAAFQVFEEAIRLACNELANYTKKKGLVIKSKPDGTKVTGNDEHIDQILTKFFSDKGFNVVSEENPSSFGHIKAGNYAIIDPIDGTLGFIEHAKKSKTGIDQNLPGEFDYALLIGIVENGIQRFGCCYNYVTGGKILLDSKSRRQSIIELGKRAYLGRTVQYIETRTSDNINKKLSQDRE